MRVTLAAFAALGLFAAPALPGSAALAQYRYDNDYRDYRHDVRRAERECRRDLRRADSRREYRRELRDCREDLREARRDYRRDQRNDWGWNGRYGYRNDNRYYWDGRRWRTRW